MEFDSIWSTYTCKKRLFLNCCLSVWMSTILQGVGLVAAVGDGVKNLKVGTPAAVMTFGSYAEFSLVYYIFAYHFLSRYIP